MKNDAEKYPSSKSSSAVTLPRRETICLILLVVLTAGWFSGGREPIALLTNSLFSLVLFGYWFFTRPVKSRLAPLPPILTVGLIGLVGTMALSWTWSINRYSSLILIISFVSATAIFIVARDILSDKTAQQFWLVLFLTAASVLAAIGLYYFFAGNYDRVISLFYWPNPLAIYLGVATVLALFGYKNSSNKMFLASAVLLLATMILTFSRAAGLSLLLAAAAIILTSQDKKIWLRNILICLSIAVVIAGGAALLRSKVFHQGNVNLAARAAETASSSNTSISDRLNYWRGAGDIYADNILKGVGAGGFASIYPRYQRQVVSATADPHNFYLQTLAELGLIGFAFVVLIIIGLLKLIWTAFKSHDEYKLVYGFTLGALLLHIGMDMDFRYPALIFLAALLMAIFTIKKETPSRSTKLTATIFYAVVLFALIGGVTVAYANYQVEVTKETLEASITPTLGGEENKAGYDKITSAIVKNPDYITDSGIYYYSQAARDKSGKTSFDKAEQLARSAIAADRYDAKHYFLLANIFLARGQNDQAIEYFKKTLELDPLNNPQYYVALADLYVRLEKYDQAKNTIDTITKLYTPEVIKNRSATPQLKTRLAILYNLKAITLYQQGDKAGALAATKRALELLPNYQDAKDFQAKIQAE